MSADPVVPCRACGSPTVERTNTQNGSRFLGCSDYPTCKETREIPAFIAMRRAGALELPGLTADRED